MNEVKQIGNVMPGTNRDNPNQGRVYDKDGLAPTISCMGGGNREPMIFTSRGRNKDNPSDRTPGAEVEQRLEPNLQGICNTLISVQKDNLVLENLFDVYNNKLRDDKICGTLTTNGNTSFTHCGTFGVIEILYRIRKLTPLECWRLMGFTDEDFRKAEQVNSNWQLYRQSGNSIVVNVLEAIFRNLNIQGVKRWEKRNYE